MSLKNLIHSYNTGPIYKLRLLHGLLYTEKIAWIIRIKSLFIKKENKVLLSAFTGKLFGDNIMPIAISIHKSSPNTQIVWICASGNKSDLPSYMKRVSLSDTKALIHECVTTSVFITNDDLFKSFFSNKNTISINTWHGGLGIKCIGQDVKKKTIESRNRTDLYISESEHLTKTYRTAFNYNGPIWKCGYPIEDAILSNEADCRKVRDRYDISSNDKIILYAPTFRDNNLWDDGIDVDFIINAFEKRFGGKWYMGIRWHHNEVADKAIPVGAIDMTDYPNMNELIKEVDAFISDYSSCIFHAALRRIPCFLYTVDYDWYKEKRGICYEYDELPFGYGFNMKELETAIMSFDETHYRVRLDAFLRRMGHIQTGHSADDIAKVCVDFLNGKSKKEIMKEIPFETDY